MKNHKFYVRGKDGRWTAKKVSYLGSVKVNFPVKKPAIDCALRSRTGIDRLPY